jgi:hypothetical protein
LSWGVVSSGVVASGVVSVGLPKRLQPPIKQGRSIAAISKKINDFFMVFLLFDVSGTMEYIKYIPSLYIIPKNTKKCNSFSNLFTK